ncbi:MAG: hypothetical protein WCN21_14975, partial [Comamonadaceae bacterium]
MTTLCGQETDNVVGAAGTPSLAPSDTGLEQFALAGVTSIPLTLKEIIMTEPVNHFARLYAVDVSKNIERKGNF